MEHSINQFQLSSDIALSLPTGLLKVLEGLPDLRIKIILAPNLEDGANCLGTMKNFCQGRNS